MNTASQIPFEAGDILLNQGIRFKVPFFFWLKLPLTIRPLHPGTIIAISQQVLKLKQVDEAENMVVELLKAGENLKTHCKIVAIGALNNPVKIKLFSRFLTWLLQWRVKDNTELLAYVSLVYKQLDAERFFFIMTLTKGMNFLNRKEKANPVESSKGAIVFGEQ